MSLTIDERDDITPLAVVKSKDKLLNGSFIYYDSNDSKGEQSMELTTSGNSFGYIPYIQKNQRFAILVCGASGSGKSSVARQLIDNYREYCRDFSYDKKEKKYKPVYLFTMAREKDPAYEGLKEFKRIDSYHKELGTLKLEFFRNSTVIFDDYDTISSQYGYVLEFIRGLLKEMLEMGRKMGISVLCLTHNPRQQSKTKDIIFECETYIVFPRYGLSHCQRFLETYAGIDKKQFEKIKNLDSRSVMIRKSVPLCVVSEKNIFML